MKKLFILLVFIFALTGCGVKSDVDILNDLKKGIKDSYSLSGALSVMNNDEIYNYDVTVDYKKPSFYRVSLTNDSNKHNQVILKNNDGVFVVTPALNKSFKFQSDWPYKNSQIYLLDALLNDINSSDYKFSSSDSKNEFITAVNYPNNKNLVKQKIIFSGNKLDKVVVYDKDDTIKMEMKFSKINYSPTFDSDYFELNNVMKTFDDSEVFYGTELDDSIFPLFVPSGTRLVNTEAVNTDNGKRIIMTFDGDKPFLLVEETANIQDDFAIIPTYGEPYLLMDTYGVMTDNSLSWSSSGIDYYLVSDVMGKDELIEVAQSITSVPALK